MQVEIRLNWLIIPAIAIIILLLGRHFTASNMLWYSSLHLPIITPPAWFMNRMWLLIYTFTTGSVLIVYNTFKRDARFWTILGLFILNAFLTFYWTYLFFRQHYLGSTILCATLLSMTLWVLMYLIRPQSLISALCLLPYALWSSFAVILTMWMWFIN